MATCFADDSATIPSRKIEIAKEGSETTVVWNPCITNAAAASDFSDKEWPQMRRIKTADAAENAVPIAFVARHPMAAILCDAPRL